MLVGLGTFFFFGFGILGLLILAVWILGLADVFRRQDLDRGARAAWVCIVVLLPLIGTFIYFWRRPTTPDERDRAARQTMRQHR
jgi:nitrate reductase gamma subunit